MKRMLVILLLLGLILQAMPVLAQDSFFPIGALLGRTRLQGPDGTEPSCSPLSMVDSAQKCGFNLVSVGGMYDGPGGHDMLSDALDYLKAGGMKCLLAQAPKLSASGATAWLDTKYNIERFASGVYSRFQAEDHPYFIHPDGGYNNGAAWVCDPGIAGTVLYRDLTPGKPYWEHNCWDAWMPFVDTLFNTQWQHYGRTEYRITFSLKYQNEDSLDTTTPGIPVSLCRIAIDTLNSVDWAQFSMVDCDTITTADFAGPNVWKTFTLKFTRLAGQTRFLDFPVYTFGNKRLFIDYVEMHDAVFDSLANQEYDPYIHNTQLTGIADYYSGPASAYKDVVYRYYMYDEPMRSQLSAFDLVNRQLKNVNANVPGLTFVCPKYPTSFGAIGATDQADTNFYSEFVNTTNPAQLAVDILPLFGDLGKEVDAPYTGNGYKTPEDSGFYFQQQMDVFSKYCRAAQRATSSSGIPWFVQIQSFGDYPDPENINLSGRWRLPTPRELKCMAYLGLSHGARGLFYYLFSHGLVSYDGYKGPSGGSIDQYAMVDTLGNVRDTAFYNAAKQINENIAIWSTTLLNLVCDQTFRTDIPAVSFITGVSDSFVQIGLFHSNTNINDKYFMLVNRHCLPSDTLTVTVNISSASTFFISDMLTGQPATGQLAAGSAVPFSYKLQPGEGRLFRVVPFTAQIKNKPKY